MGWNGGRRSVWILNLDFSGDKIPGADLGKACMQEITSYQSLKLSRSLLLFVYILML